MLASGGGIGLRLLLDRPDAPTVHGVEVSTEMIRQAQAAFAGDLAAGRLRLHHASITALPLATSSLDGIITVNTVYFVDDLDQAFSELARTLASPGRAVIGIGDPDAMGKLSFTAHGFRLRRHRYGGCHGSRWTQGQRAHPPGRGQHSRSPARIDLHSSH